ncbi:MAG: D-Ala-D-Ala carboxypeptidase family metallohydrolase [Cyclobacteriaceae bacterium]
MIRKTVTALFFIMVLTGIFVWYATSLRNVNPVTISYYHQLRDQLTVQGYQPNVFVMSAKRAEWHNKLLTHFGAANKSQHLSGNAIDILVMDVNQDNNTNSLDVKIAKGILENIIKNDGGIGTYQSENIFWNKQMVHFDCRGYRARWNR